MGKIIGRVFRTLKEAQGNRYECEEIISFNGDFMCIEFDELMRAEKRGNSFERKTNSERGQ